MKHLGTNTKKISIMMLVLCMVLSTMMVFGVADSAVTWSTPSAINLVADDLEAGSISAHWTAVTDYGGTLAPSSTQAHSGTYSALSTTGAKSPSNQIAYFYKNFGISYPTMISQAWIYWNSGNPANADEEGIKLMGLGNQSITPSITPIIYNNGGSYVLGVRANDNYATTWTNYLSTQVVSTGTWFKLELSCNATGFRLFYNNAAILSRDNIGLCPTYTTVTFGTNYGGTNAASIYVDDPAVAYVGDAAITQYISEISTMYTNSTYKLQYPAIFDGYLYTALSHSSSTSIHPVIVKRDATTLAEVSETTLNNGEYEVFTPQVLGNYLLCPSIAQYGTYKGGLTILNKDTLAQVAYIEVPFTQSSCFFQVVLDYERNQIYLGSDTHNGYYGFFKCDMAHITEQNAYTFVQMASCPDTAAEGLETQIAIFKGNVYVLCSSPSAGFNGQIRTRMYHSNDLSTWTQDFEKLGVNSATGSYFGHIAATANYIVAGVISNATTGVSTYRLEYSTSVGGSWSEMPTGVTEKQAEDHPTINALNDDIFLYEPNARTSSGSTAEHMIYIINLSTGTSTFIGTPIFNGEISTGYNDRWAAIDTENHKVYVADSLEGAEEYGSIIQLSMNPELELKTPDYTTPQPKVAMWMTANTASATGTITDVTTGQSTQFNGIGAYLMVDVGDTVRWTFNDVSGKEYKYAMQNTQNVTDQIITVENVQSEIIMAGHYDDIVPQHLVRFTTNLMNCGATIEDQTTGQTEYINSTYQIMSVNEGDRIVITAPLDRNSPIENHHLTAFTLNGVGHSSPITVPVATYDMNITAIYDTTVPSTTTPTPTVTAHPTLPPHSPAPPPSEQNESYLILIVLACIIGALVSLGVWVSKRMDIN